ncbi:MAG: lysophospholipid acyltransferase family protein [Gammaproteobacteria bacterium]|nr:lysophospholipid acyltransferase family protein [Gammaproteobacteria bacterium]
MLKIFAKSFLKLIGWQLEITLPEEKKFILIGAPHTSNWDFPLALLVFWTLDLKINWVAKAQMFRGPLHYLFTALGGIPVDRSKSHGFINQIAERFTNEKEMVLSIAPEGTRSKTQYWKSGFYHIAIAADVPICLGYIDYQHRKLGFAQLIYPSGDIEKDMLIIANFYKNIKGKRPQNQSDIKIKS